MLSRMTEKLDQSLSQLGVKEHWLYRVREVRAKFDRLAQMGTPLMPDFTLHNVAHSDNLILLLAELREKRGFVLNEYEAYLLATACYLHDLGMFFSGARFEQNILPAFDEKLQFCPRNCCDHTSNYSLAGKQVAEQIRLTHNLLSAYRLREENPATFGIERDDVPHVLTLCRAHRVTNLRAECDCYQTKQHNGWEVRVGLLASLLRLADGLDFFANRAPVSAFQHRALDFLRNPVALEHWIKHYFVAGPYITVQDRQGNQTLECQLRVTTPMKEINGQSYLEFVWPLFEKHTQGDSDLRRDTYPPILFQVLRIDNMVITLVPDEIAGARDFPVEVVSRIAESGCKDILAFLDRLEHPLRQEGGTPLLNREKERQMFHEMVSRRRHERLMFISGEGGQGKSYLMQELKRIAIKENLECVSFDFKLITLDYKIVLEQLRKILPNVPFPDYESYRDTLSNITEAPTPAEQRVRRREITKKFSSDWRKVSDAPRIFLAFDSYEDTGSEVRLWLETEFLPAFVDTADVVIVISGRQVPDKSNWEWIMHFHLDGLEPRCWREYAQLCGLRASYEATDLLHELHDGKPLEMVKSIDSLVIKRGRRR